MNNPAEALHRFRSSARNSTRSASLRKMLDYLRRKMGAETFERFAKALMTQPEMSLASFREIAARFLPGSGPDVDFPERSRRRPADPRGEFRILKGTVLRQPSFLRRSRKYK